MKSMRLLTAVLTAALLVACASSDQKRGTRHYNIIAVEDEWQLGAALAADIARQAQFVTDPQALTYLRTAGERIARQSTLSNLPWEFHILVSPDVYAYAIPGGHVYITTGAFKSMRTASELAGLLAHVLGHAVDRQTTAALSSRFGVKELASAANGGNPGVYQQVLAQMLPTAQPARFTTEEEKIANESAVKWMQAGGDDPNGLVAMFRNLQALQNSNPAAVQKFFAAHPVSTESLADIQAQIAKLPKKAGLVTDEPEFHAAQARM